MLTGKKAFAGDDVSDTLATVLKFEPDWSALPDDAPDSIRRLLRRCLIKDPKLRLRDAGWAIVEIRDATTSAGDSDMPLRPRPRSAPAIWQRPLPLLLTGLVVALLSGLAGSLLSSPTSTPPRSVGRFTIDFPPSTGFSVRAGQPVAISRDGRRLVFNASVDGVNRLFSRPLDQIDALPIGVDAGPGGPGSIFLSPDGESVAFIATGDLTIKRVRVDGGVPTTICPTGLTAGGWYGGTWGAAGTIVFATVTSGGLMRVAAGGGTPASLTVAPEGVTHSQPHFLPDGESLLFAVVREGEPEAIVVLPAGASEPTRLLEGTSPAFAASGHLLFAREGAVWAVPFDPERLQITGDAAPVLEDVSILQGGMAQLTVSDDGTLVYVTGSGETRQPVALVDMDGTEEALPGIAVADWRTVRLSPDGRRLALSDTAGDVWTYDLERQTLNPVTTSVGFRGQSLWAPDGRDLLFASREGEAGALLRTRSDGTATPETLFTDPGVRQVIPGDWTADGAVLVSEVLGGDVDIAVLELGTNPTRTSLVATPVFEAHPALSPDGRWLAYQSEATGRMEVYIDRYPDLGDRQRISLDGGTNPLWSPDDSALYFLTLTRQEIMRVSTPTESGGSWGVPGVVVETATLATGVFQTPYAVMFDDQGFVTISPADDVRADEAPHFVVVHNWFDELTERVPIP